MALNWNLSPLMVEIVEAIERLGGGGREADVAREAASRGENGRYGEDAHFAKGIRELESRGILNREMMGARRNWWMTERAWRDRGHDGPVPGTDQIGFF